MTHHAADQSIYMHTQTHKGILWIPLRLNWSFIIKNRKAHYKKITPYMLGLNAQVCNMKQCVDLMEKVWTKVPSQLWCNNEMLC